MKNGAKIIMGRASFSKAGLGYNCKSAVAITGFTQETQYDCFLWKADDNGGDGFDWEGLKARLTDIALTFDGARIVRKDEFAKRGIGLDFWFWYKGDGVYADTRPIYLFKDRNGLDNVSFDYDGFHYFPGSVLKIGEE